MLVCGDHLLLQRRLLLHPIDRLSLRRSGVVLSSFYLRAATYYASE